MILQSKPFWTPVTSAAQLQGHPSGDTGTLSSHRQEGAERDSEVSMHRLTPGRDNGPGTAPSASTRLWAGVKPVQPK